MAKALKALPIAAVCAIFGLVAPVGSTAGALSLPVPGKLSVVAGDGKGGPPTPGPAVSSDLSGPTGVAADSRGDLFIADSGNNVVEEVTPAGKLSVIAGDGQQGPPTPGPATKSALDDPTGLAVDSRGDLFIGDYGNNVVEEVTPDGRLSVVVGDGQKGPPTRGLATKSALDGPGFVAVDTRGDLFISDAANFVVEKVTPAGKLSVVAGVVGQPGAVPTPGPATSAKLGIANGLAVDSRGDLFIVDTRELVVDEVAPNGRLSVVAGESSTSIGEKWGPPTPGPARNSAFYYPIGVAVDAHGDLFIGDSENYCVEEVTRARRLSVVAGVVDHPGIPTRGSATTSELGRPMGVAVDSRGDLYIADATNFVEKVTGISESSGGPAPAPSPSPSPSPPPVPAGPSLNLSFATVAPGGREVATVVVDPGVSAVLIVNYSNGEQQVVGPKVAGASAHVVLSWNVPEGVTGYVNVIGVRGGSTLSAGALSGIGGGATFTVTGSGAPAASTSTSTVPTPSTSTVPASSPCISPAIVGQALSLCFASVAPGGQQVVTLDKQPGSSAVLLVAYPSGKLQALGPAVADSSGNVVVTWEVPKVMNGGTVYVMMLAGETATCGENCSEVTVPISFAVS